MPTLQNLLHQADSYQQKISSAQPPAKEELESFDHDLRIGFIYSSNALEGNTLTLSETKILLEDGITANGKSLKDNNEATSHADAYDHMLNQARLEQTDITEEAIRNLHRLLYQKVDAGQAGQYRTTQAYISSTEYTPPAPEDVPHLMKHLADQIHFSRSTLHPIELAAMAHKRFVDIHPFMHGNGQTARLLMNLILVHNGYVVTSIPAVLENNYINALSTSRHLNDMEPFSIFIAECVMKSEQDYCQLLKL